MFYGGGHAFGLGSARYRFIREAGKVTKVRVDLVGHSSIAIRQQVAERVATP